MLRLFAIWPPRGAPVSMHMNPRNDVVSELARLVGEASPRFRTVIGIDARTMVTLRRMVPDRLFASGIRRLMHLPRSR